MRYLPDEDKQVVTLWCIDGVRDFITQVDRVVVQPGARVEIDLDKAVVKAEEGDLKVHYYNDANEWVVEVRA